MSPPRDNNRVLTAPFEKLEEPVRFAGKFNEGAAFHLDSLYPMLLRITKQAVLTQKQRVEGFPATRESAPAWLADLAGD